MGYVEKQVERLAAKYKTRDPFELLDCVNAITFETDKYTRLKGYCFLSCRSTYVAVNTYLPKEEKRMVAAHELGHITLHKNLLKLAPMQDSVLYDMRTPCEYEANLFAANLLVCDSDVEQLAGEMDYFDLCKTLSVSPELMSFKLYSLVQRGYRYNLPIGLNSKFLAKSGTE